METWTPQLVDEIRATLNSIDRSLKQLVKQQGPQAARVADDRALDAKWGDPLVKSMPRFWTGDTYIGQCYSACPPELLDLIAEQQEWSGNRAEAQNEQTDAGKPIASYRFAAAAKARGWAKRKREGWTAPATTPSAQGWATAPREPLPLWADSDPDAAF